MRGLGWILLAGVVGGGVYLASQGALGASGGENGGSTKLPENVTHMTNAFQLGSMAASPPQDPSIVALIYPPEWRDAALREVARVAAAHPEVRYLVAPTPLVRKYSPVELLPEGVIGGVGGAMDGTPVSSAQWTEDSEASEIGPALEAATAAATGEIESALPPGALPNALVAMALDFFEVPLPGPPVPDPSIPDQDPDQGPGPQPPIPDPDPPTAPAKPSGGLEPDPPDPAEPNPPGPADAVTGFRLR